MFCSLRFSDFSTRGNRRKRNRNRVGIYCVISIYAYAFSSIPTAGIILRLIILNDPVKATAGSRRKFDDNGRRPTKFDFRVSLDFRVDTVSYMPRVTMYRCNILNRSSVSLFGRLHPFRVESKTRYGSHAVYDVPIVAVGVSGG